MVMELFRKFENAFIVWFSYIIFALRWNEFSEQKGSAPPVGARGSMGEEM